MEKEEITLNIARNLFRYRNWRRLRQDQLAKKCDLSTATICMIETCQTTPNIFNLLKICSALEISVDKLIQRRPGRTEITKAELVRMIEGIRTRTIYSESSSELKVIQIQMSGKALVSPPDFEGKLITVSMLCGFVRIEFDRESHFLKRGERVTFRAEQTFEVRNLLKKPASFVYVTQVVANFI